MVFRFPKEPFIGLNKTQAYLRNDKYHETIANAIKFIINIFTLHAIKTII